MDMESAKGSQSFDCNRRSNAQIFCLEILSHGKEGIASSLRKFYENRLPTVQISYISENFYEEFRVFSTSTSQTLH